MITPIKTNVITLKTEILFMKSAIKTS